MTNVDVSDDVREVVEDTELPERLRNRIYETVADRSDVTAEQVADVAQAVESRYLETRVDPLDPVGTVSAQSIGEPGTQMSIPADEEILIRRDGHTKTVEIGQFVDGLLESRESRKIDDHEVAQAPPNTQVPSLDRDEQIRWSVVEEVSRHRTPDELLRFELESGRSVRATKSHSFVTRENNEIVPVAGDSLECGDQLPTVGSFDESSGKVDIPLNQTEQLVTDGGAQSAEVISEDVIEQATWEEIVGIDQIQPDDEYVYDLSVAGLETFTTAEGVITHNTMNTFHYAGVAEIDVTQGLPRLIELVDARKTPDTPMMTVHLEEEYATDRERTHEVVWQIEATKILALGDISTNVADMVVQVDLNEETLQERWPTVEDTEEIAGEIADTIQSKLGVETARQGTVVQFGPEQPSYRELLQLVEELRDIVFKGIDEISRVVIRKEDIPDREEDEFVLYTEGSAFGDVIEIEGVDATRTTCNNIHEIRDTLGIEAARESIINETMDTLEEQGLGDVNIRHLMLVADIMTNTGEIESIGRHGISGSKNSVLARAAFEVTVSHLLDAAVYGEVDELDGVTENVIVGKPIKLGTGDVNLRMRASDIGDEAESADD